jgi:predicted PurR-regulated permease PerM
VLLFAFYFAADGPRLRRTVASWMRPDRQRTFLTVWDISTQKACGYVISRGIMALISAIYHGIVFYIIDLPYWLPMALWVGLVSQFIPTIGTYLAGALPIILALAEGDWVKALIVLVAVTAYQQVENYYVQPRVTQSTLEIHAAVAFGSVIVGATLFGATGALLAIPVVATLQAVAETYGKRYELVDELRDPREVSELPESRYPEVEPGVPTD